MRIIYNIKLLSTIAHSLYNILKFYTYYESKH